jgi:hypothetical protein
MKRWSPPVELTKKEAFIMKRLKRVRALFGFLRQQRHVIFDDAFQEKLEGMYRDTGAGDEPHPPAMLCMVVLLQGYVGASDAEAVELTMMDLRWQMVLDCMNADEPPFSQGALQSFRERLIAHEMDRALLERTVALVRAGAVSDADGKALSKAVRVALDSRPLAGAGRVEDTINLLGHAARSIVRLVRKLTGWNEEDICRKAGIPLLLASSIKAGLDIDWSDPKQKVTAIEVVERQVSSLERWVERHLDDAVAKPLTPFIEALSQVRAQDLDTHRDKVRIRRGVAAERRISIEDPEMRHGRKSKTQRFNGYKEHIARDLDLPVIVAVAVTPANRPEEEGAAPIRDDIEAQGFKLIELNIDRAYVNSPVVYDVLEAGGDVRAKPWGQRPRLPGMFSKRDFVIDARTQTIRCPEGQVEPFEPGMTVEFDPEICGACPRRSECTTSASGRGRTVSIGDDEGLQSKLRLLQQTKRGRRHLRERVQVEHALAHVAARKGDTARYVGVRKNLFDLRRAAAIQNLEAVHRLSLAA